MSSIPSREINPIFIKTLRNFTPDNKQEEENRKKYGGCGHYETIQKLITSSPYNLSSSSSSSSISSSGCEIDTTTAEIESCLEQFIGSSDGSVLWRRVVVRSGPSCPQQIIHASYMLPQDSINNFGVLQTNNPSVLCWTAFPDRPDHPLLCVLANPTLLCIWDVYPSSSSASSEQQLQEGGIEGKKTFVREELEGGEGHNIPLPFECCAIYAVGDGKHGLLLQRCESTEDIIAFDNKIMNNNSNNNNNNNNDNNNTEADDHADDGFVLKAPPRPVRLARDSTGGSTLASLNVSTASTPTMMGGGGGGGGVGEGGGGPTSLLSTSLIPSIFSLHHPQGDILPVSNFAEGDLQAIPATDVFEKILYTGVIKWVNEDCSSYMNIKQHSQPICVTYHSQLRRHAVWEIKHTPPPPPAPPLWQVSRQWRSKNGWDSHLGVLQQDLEDFELVDGVVESSSHPYDVASRNEALADALGVRKTTPRNATSAADNPVPTTRAARAGVSGAGMPNRSSKAKTPMNISLLSPLSRPANESHTLEVNNSIADQTVALAGIGPFASLHPKTAMTCIYVDPIPSPPAENIFLASNSSGSGTLSLCIVCPSTQEESPSLLNQNELKVFSFAPIVESNSHQNDLTVLNNLGRQFVVQSEGSVPCVTAQPIEASPIPKNYEPHRSNKHNSWTGMATDILLLRYHAHDVCKLSLYRNTHHIADCTISNFQSTSEYDQETSSIKIIGLKNSSKDIVDIVYLNDIDQPRCLRGRLSLILNSNFMGEALIQTVEASLENIGLEVVALKMRADCVRLEHSTDLTKGIGADVAKIVVLSLFRLEMLGIDDTVIAMDTDLTERSATKRNQTQWEKLLEYSKGESYSAECQELLAKTSPIDDIKFVSKEGTASISFADLSRIRSLAVQHLRSSEISVSATVFDALHMFYEEMKLHSSKLDEGLSFVGSILCDVCFMASCNSTIPDDLPEIYLSYYSLDLENYQLQSSVTTEIENLQGKDVSKNLENLKLSSFVSPPSILSWIEEVLSGNSKGSHYANINRVESNATCTRIRSFLRIFPSLHIEDQSSLGDSTKILQHTKDHEVVKLLIEEGLSNPEALRDELPVGISLPLLELLHRCRTEGMGENKNINAAVWSLIGRDDLYKNMSGMKQGLPLSPAPSTSSSSPPSSHSVDESGDRHKDGITDLESTSSMLFPDDNRIREVGRLLRSSKSIYLRVPRAIEVSDHDYERQKQEKLLLLSRRVLALPVGRGMFTIGNLKPVPAEPLPLPDICLSGRIPPTNSNMALDVSECPVDMNVWPEFHNGVAAGLRLPLQLDGEESISKITRTWIVYNRPSNNSQVDSQNNANASDNNSQGLNHAHGGLLMALGMRGHLAALEMTDIFDYLTHGSVTTTVGCLLGMAAK